MPHVPADHSLEDDLIPYSDDDYSDEDRNERQTVPRVLADHGLEDLMSYSGGYGVGGDRNRRRDPNQDDGDDSYREHDQSYSISFHPSGWDWQQQGQEEQQGMIRTASVLFQDKAPWLSTGFGGGSRGSQDGSRRTAAANGMPFGARYVHRESVCDRASQPTSNQRREATARAMLAAFEHYYPERLFIRDVRVCVDRPKEVLGPYELTV